MGGDDEDPSNPYGGEGTYSSVPMKRLKRAVLATGSETFPIGKQRSPIAHQGTVILSSASVVVDLGRTRMNALRTVRGTEPNYPLAAPKDGVYNVQQGELVFTDIRRDRDGTTFSAASSGKLWSSFNGLCTDVTEPVWIGVSDVMHNLGQSEAMALQPEFSVAMAGSRTILAGPDRIHLGAQVMWEYPYAVDDGKNGLKPGLTVENRPAGKFCAHAAPMSFMEYGSAHNIHRNFMSRYASGAYRPSAKNVMWKGIEKATELMMRVAADGTLDDKTVCDELSKWSSPFRNADSYRMDLNAIKTVGAVDGKDAQTILVLSQFVFSTQNLVDFALKRRIGTAMSTGRLGATDVLLGK